MSTVVLLLLELGIDVSSPKKEKFLCRYLEKKFSRSTFDKTLVLFLKNFVVRRFGASNLILKEKIVTFVVLLEFLLCLGCGPSHGRCLSWYHQEDEDVRWISVGRNFHRCCHQQRICLKATSQLLKTKCVKSLLAIERTRDRQLLEKLKLISECGPNSYSVKRN